ncbi:MAG: hypothetical protein KKG84_06200, partial [Candidatus Omnitrophica bacterium]|nr:hypothetical protein [Candidatus Omnitrophota bacterium]
MKNHPEKNKNQAGAFFDTRAFIDALKRYLYALGHRGCRAAVGHGWRLTGRMVRRLTGRKAIILASGVMAVLLVWAAYQIAQSASLNSTLTETDWSGGVGTIETQFSACDANMNYTTAEELKLTISMDDNTETDDTDLGAGTETKTMVTGTGTSASVKLDPATSTGYQNDPSAYDDSINAIAIDHRYMYLTGTDRTFSATNARWRVDKRSLTDGSMVTAFSTDGIVTSNPTAFDDEPRAIAVDGSYLYIAGYKDSTGKIASVEKINKTDGSYDTGFGTTGKLTGTSGFDIKVIATDGVYMYLAGSDANGLSIEKRELSDGTLEALFDGDTGASSTCTGNGVINDLDDSGTETGGVTANAIAIDGTYMYVAGDNGTNIYIEKRTLATGGLVDAFDTDGTITGAAGTANAIAIDTDEGSNGYMYIAGKDSSGWYIEKRDLSDGSLETTSFGSPNGYISGGSGTEAMAIACDGTYIYIAGFDTDTDTAWRMEKRSKSSGDLASVFGTSGAATSDPAASTDDEPSAIAIDGTYMYIVGFDTVGTDEEWRVEKRPL